jgi:hypothetical protein
MGLSDFEASTAPRDVVRRQYAASAAGDLEALRATLAPDVEWTEMAGFPLAGTYRTPEGVTANVMEELGADWIDWTAHDDTYVVDGENVVVLARYTAANKATGQPIDVRPPLHRERRAHRPLRAVRRHRQGPRRHGREAAARPRRSGSGSGIMCRPGPSHSACRAGRSRGLIRIPAPCARHARITRCISGSR